ncbi:Y-family DNA polymerase [Vibrio sp. Y42_MX_L11]|uniref:Y-family DNA polymerase n=1 Tax=Vibrio TaxID=662 RepID=UPI0020A3B7D8|nr:Y-family DNA polymerase [Vibrio parahaemolyticus]
MFALVDANSFYCSAEQVFRPDLRGKPIVVLSNNDGCIVAANRQAKELGIPKFSPYFKVQSECELKGVIAFSSNYELYSDLSSKMMNVIGRFAPEQFVYSIDESFLSFERTSSAIPCLIEHGQKLRKAVWKECRLPVCVGFGTTLTLAKLANHLAKKNRELNGVCLLEDKHIIEQHLKSIDVGDVWGIGRRLSKRMQFMGINTAYDLMKRPPALIRKDFNVEVERTCRELNGEVCKKWDFVKADKQQIFSTRSVGERITDLDSLRQALVKHAGIASRKAREQHSQTRVMMCFASSSPYDDNPASFKITHRFAYPTSDITQLSKVAGEAAEQLFKEGVRYYKIGVGLLDLSDRRNEQLDLLNDKPSNDKLNSVFDSLNKKYGTDSVFIAAQGVEQKWSMKRQLLSKQYTTKWSDLPKISCR